MDIINVNNGLIMTQKNTDTLRIRLPAEISKKLEEDGNNQGLCPSTLVRSLLVQHYKVKKV